MRDTERWFQLCQLATIEDDPAKLLALLDELNRMIEKQDADKKRSDFSVGHGRPAYKKPKGLHRSAGN